MSKVTCPNLYWLKLDGGTRRYRCCRLHAGFMLKHWRCTPGDCPKPQRLQRKRAKGYRMPTGAVYVGRPTKWGNPYRVSSTTDPVWKPRGKWKLWHDDNLLRVPSVVNYFNDKSKALKKAVELYRAWLKYQIRMSPQMRQAVEQLRGKDLLCWCAIGEPCHADVLLEVANG